MRKRSRITIVTIVIAFVLIIFNLQLGDKFSEIKKQNQIGSEETLETEKTFSEVSAGYCFEMYRTGDERLYVVHRDPENSNDIISITDVDYANIQEVEKHSAIGKGVAEEKGQEYKSTIYTIDQWIKDWTFPIEFIDNINGPCAPGHVVFKGTFDENQVLIAEEITAYGQ